MSRRLRIPRGLERIEARLGPVVDLAWIVALIEELLAPIAVVANVERSCSLRPEIPKALAEAGVIALGWASRGWLRPASEADGRMFP